jgi:ADP-ribosylglycohydrolase
MTESESRKACALLALAGLSVGDAFGDQFFVERSVLEYRILNRAEPPGPWFWTDDTNMALSIAEVLVQYGNIDQNALAASFAARYDMSRGYGPAMHRVLRRIASGVPWREVAGSEFEGQGSYGNGSAMRVAPVGAWFADDLDHVVAMAAASAVVTHAHSEAVAGAVAVAIAAALAWRSRDEPASDWSAFLRQVSEHVPDSEVLDRLRRTERFDDQTSTAFAAAVLGVGADLSCVDTVPFALWIAATSLDNFADAMWRAVEEAIDVDTICAIVGGIVAMRVGFDAIPTLWRERTESLPMRDARS